MALRTPDDRFENLQGYGYDAEYVDVETGEEKTRVAYVDEGDGDETFLCLHGEPTWSYLYRKMVPTLAEKGRVVVPDLPGFGRSDKFEDEEEYTFASEYDAVGSFVHELDLTDVTLVCQDWGGILGLSVAARNPERFARLVPMNTGLQDGSAGMPDEWKQFRDFVAGADELPLGFMVDAGCVSDLSDEVKAGYEAPFPDASYQAGALALPLRVPTSTDDPGADEVAETRELLSDWDKPAFVLFSDSDPITGPARDDLRALIPTADEQPDIRVENAGHFLQEDAGERVAQHIVEFVERT
ncbi:haloalkane dehalogenase [Haladaptatus sp. F3-133]|uniref:Haloalkane dehalogenase n=1 Tax=Halorutilus salinus TaxID=2487751 RepID=A0A9Q4C411_9EURY|nr:haloalkane dehalogenase [Halorutilus salinus]MCX2818696.1 haloalkane dehalogenase [Halorutilus salinus]